MLFALLPPIGAGLLPTPALPVPRLTVASLQHRTTNVQAKFVGAALAAAFAAKNDDKSSSMVPSVELSLEEKEDRVIEAIREGLEAGVTKPKAALSAGTLPMIELSNLPMPLLIRRSHL